MDNIEDDANYPPNPHDLSQDYESSQHLKLHVQSLSSPQHNNFADVDNGGDNYDTEETEDDDDDNGPNGYNSRMIQDADLVRQEKKKRKLKALLSNYILAPRAVVTPSVPKRSRAGRNSLTDWTEHESNVLLDTWGERFLKHGRKNVRSEDWHEVAGKVSEGSRIKRTETQCRNRLDTLKKKYKKEKAMLAESEGVSSKWLYFEKMDMFLSPPPNPANGDEKMDLFLSLPSIPANVDEKMDIFLSPPSNPANGDVSMTSKVHPSRANSLDEIKDSLVGDSEVKEESYNLEDLPPKKTRMDKGGGEGDPFKLLADSIDKFSETYEKVESSKSKQLVELEKTRMEFQRDLELQKRKILKRTQVEIAKIWGHIDDDNDLSPDNATG